VKTDNSSLFCDAVEIDDGDCVILRGHARIQFDGSEDPNIVGDEVKILTDGTVIADGTELGPKIDL
jgi:hypothetical protein